MDRLSKNKTREIYFIKIHGAGNDFILIDNFENKYKFDLPKLARKVCPRRIGIGADGLLVIEKSKKADFKMRYLNADGTEVGMCGNGGRCISFYAFNNLLKNKKKLSFEALNKIYLAELVGKNIRLIMNNPTDFRTDLEIKHKNTNIKFDFLNTGAPHVCIFTSKNPILNNKNFADMDIIDIGKFLRYHKYFSPEGTNVNFIKIRGVGNIDIRTYERGVEDETLSCGTGSIACGILSALRYNWKPPIVVNTLNKFKLIIDFKLHNNKLSNVSLEGASQIVYSGIFKI